MMNFQAGSNATAVAAKTEGKKKKVSRILRRGLASRWAVELPSHTFLSREASKSRQPTLRSGPVEFHSDIESKLQI